MDTSVPLNYYTVFKHIQDIIPKGEYISFRYFSREYNFVGINFFITQDITCILFYLYFNINN